MKTGSQKFLRSAKRQDEDSLYMLIKRDLDRQVIFPGCSYWETQVCLQPQKDRIDFLIHYSPPYDEGIGEPKINAPIEEIFLIGIESKFNFPHLDDFEQAIRYKDKNLNQSS